MADEFTPARLAKSLLRRSRQGALATLMKGSGNPYCSLVNVASAPDGAPILLISQLALHTQNLLADSRVSLMLDERAAGDPLEGSRIMLSGNAEEATDEAEELLRRRYLSAHPAAEMFAGFGDFGFFRIAPSGLHLVAGFGRIVDLKPQDFMTDVAGAASLIAAEPDILAHMNEDHCDTMALYASALLGAEAADWRATGCDPDGLDLDGSAEDAPGKNVLRLEFGQRILSPAAVRQELKRLADLARAAK